jgi:uroporphyrinogen decarboxylase
MSTARDCFFAAVRHERPDRVPTDLWARPEIIRALREHLGTDDVERALGVDFAEVSIADRFPAFDRRAAGPRGGDWPGSGERYVWHDERTFEDGWGIVQRVGEDGKLVQWISGPLSGTEEPGIPTVESTLPASACLAEPSEVAGAVQRLKAAGKVVCSEVCMPFKRAWHLRGLENLLVDMLIRRDFVDALYDRIYAFETERAVRSARAGVDVVKVVGDIAMERGLMFGPSLFRELDVPRLRAMIERTRSARPGVLMFYHSDGDISGVMDDLIDAGFDIINPIQPECMDPYEVKRRWGDRITMWGTVSVRTTLPKGTPDEVRELVRERIRVCGRDGGFVLAPANVIMYDTPIGNVVAMYEAARAFRWED